MVVYLTPFICLLIGCILWPVFTAERTVHDSDPSDSDQGRARTCRDFLDLA